MTDRRITMDRIKVGGLALVFLFAAVVLFFYKPEWSVLRGTLIRVGILLSVFWIALPSKTKPAAWANISPWAVIPLLSTLFLIAKFPIIMIPIIAVLGVLTIFSHSRGGGSIRR